MPPPSARKAPARPSIPRSSQPDRNTPRGVWRYNRGQMRHQIGTSIGLGLLLLGAGTMAPAQAPAPKLQALIITGQNGHDWRATTPVLRKLLEDTRPLRSAGHEEFRGAGAGTLAPYDVVILNYYEGASPRSAGASAPKRAGQLRARRQGAGGLPLLHRRLRRLDRVRKNERRQLAAEQRPPLRAPRFHGALSDRDHPITRGMKASFPQPNDELYANLKWQPAGYVSRARHRLGRPLALQGRREAAHSRRRAGPAHAVDRGVRAAAACSSTRSGTTPTP